MGKKKKKEPEIVPYKIESYDEADRKLLDYGIYQSKIAEIEAAMNEELQRVTDRYIKNPELNFAKEESVKIFAGIKDFCDKREKDFKRRKTRKMTNGRIGYRLHQIKCVNLNSGFKTADIINKLRRALGMKKYIRKTETINKELILNDYKDKDIKLTNEMLAKAGLRIEREEKFFCKPNWASLKNDNAA